MFLCHDYDYTVRQVISLTRLKKTNLNQVKPSPAVNFIEVFINLNRLCSLNELFYGFHRVSRHFRDDMNRKPSPNYTLYQHYVYLHFIFKQE